MTILGRWIRDLLERLLGRFHEGPEAPPRLADEVRLFRCLSSKAPAEEEWEAFAVKLAEQAYRDGFVRGYHWLERSWDGPEVEPEQLLEMQLHNQRLFPDGQLPEPLDARKVAEFQEAIGRAAASGVDVYLEHSPTRGRIR